jgi:hypothetical protein
MSDCEAQLSTVSWHVIRRRNCDALANGFEAACCGQAKQRELCRSLEPVVDDKDLPGRDVMRHAETSRAQWIGTLRGDRSGAGDDRRTWPDTEHLVVPITTDEIDLAAIGGNE